MSKKFTLNQLTEGIRSRNVGQEGARLTEKWSRTGLLRGLEDTNRENMAAMLENQAAQLLRESNTMAGGDVGGFTNIAFPIVRRVFGGLVANELVSIQPMSLPSGLLFYLDYTYGSDVGSAYASGDSIYGGPDGRDVQTGALGAGGQYDLVGSGYSSGAWTKTSADVTVASLTLSDVADTGATGQLHRRLLDYDEQAITHVEDAAGAFTFGLLPVTTLSTAGLDLSRVKEVAISDIGSGTGSDGGAGCATNLAATFDSTWQGGSSVNLRRLNKMVKAASGTAATVSFSNYKEAPTDGTHVLVVMLNATAGTVLTSGLIDVDAKSDDGAGSGTSEGVAGSGAQYVHHPDSDTVTAMSGGGVGEMDADPGFEGNLDGAVGAAGGTIPEIDIKIESIAVTAQTRKLRARWSPELAQDLNAYHSMDAEVELTQILSEQIALEIDREILNDLLVGANGANLYWSRAPGRFLNKNTGAPMAEASTTGVYSDIAFTGTVREWYETLTETIIDVANQIHRKTLRGSANFIVVGPDVATILESSVMYKPNYKLDGQGQVGSSFSIGAEKVGALSNRFTVYKDPYFPRNKILVGFKGGSYLETGYVYAPYVPLIVTPTIFQPDDFTPRKGVMTRYGKKMVRSDFYGTVTVLDMHII